MPNFTTCQLYDHWITMILIVSLRFCLIICILRIWGGEGDLATVVLPRLTPCSVFRGQFWQCYRWRGDLKQCWEPKIGSMQAKCLTLKLFSASMLKILIRTKIYFWVSSLTMALPSLLSDIARGKWNDSLKINDWHCVNTQGQKLLPSRSEIHLGKNDCWRLKPHSNFNSWVKINPTLARPLKHLCWCHFNWQLFKCT